MRYKDFRIVEDNYTDRIDALLGGNTPGRTHNQRPQSDYMDTDAANADSDYDTPIYPANGSDRSNEPTASNTEQGLQSGPPYPQEDRQRVRTMQRKLEDLGYSVGNTGIDGKYGPRTTRAVRAFKQDNNISTSAGSMSEQELQALSRAERVENPTPTGNESQSRSFDAGELAALDFGGADNNRAREIAQEFLGNEISDSDWDMLVRATVAEASPNQRERAAVMAVILNRVRSGEYPNSVSRVLTQKNQFQAVTGTPRDRSPSRNFTNPTRNQVAGVVQAVIDHLENSNSDWLNFTSNNPRAYGPGTNIDFMYAMRDAPGSRVIGGTVFGTV